MALHKPLFLVFYLLPKAPIEWILWGHRGQKRQVEELEAVGASSLCVGTLGAK